MCGRLDLEIVRRHPVTMVLPTRTPFPFWLLVWYVPSVINHEEGSRSTRYIFFHWLFCNLTHVQSFVWVLSPRALGVLGHQRLYTHPPKDVDVPYDPSPLLYPAPGRSGGEGLTKPRPHGSDDEDRSVNLTSLWRAMVLSFITRLVYLGTPILRFCLSLDRVRSRTPSLPFSK